MIPSSTSSPIESTETKRAYRRSIFDAICVAFLIAYFLYFAIAAVRGGFREDEMMNMGICWCAGALKSLLANIVFWKLFLCPGDALYDLPLYLYRPGGALYYLPLYHFFDLDPLPYRIVQISILVASIPLVYYLSRRLASSRSIAFLAVLALCYHPRLAGLAFVGAFIYDVLCGFFYFAALAYYVHIRERGVSLRPLQLLGFLALYVMALNCKEMTVTLPVIVLIYEFLKSPGWTDWKAFLRWIRTYAAPSLIAGLLTVFYIYGKIHGSGSLASLDPYRPIYSWHNFTTSNAKFVSQLLFAGHAIAPIALLLLWALVFIYAFLRRDRTLQLMAFWIVIVPLPVAFIVPVRGDASLYLLLFGWAMIFAKVASDLIELLCKFSLLIRQGARGGAATGAITRSTPTGGVRGTATGAAAAAAAAAAGNMSQTTLRIAATLVVAFALAMFTKWKNPPSRVRAFQNAGQKTSHVAQAFRALDLRPAPGSTILVKGNPFIPGQGWNALFIPSLLWNDHSLRIWLDGLNKLTPQQLQKMDYIILLSEFHAEVIRSPESQQR